MIRKVLAMLMLVMSCNASATSITYNGYSLDDTTDIVTGGGLEWLQWDVTYRMSIIQALENVAGVYEGGGWRLASNADVAGLFNAFEFGGASFTWDTDEATHQSVSLPSNGNVENVTDLALVFRSMFGSTYTAKTSHESNPLVWSAALFGEYSDSAHRYNTAVVYDDYAEGWGTQEDGLAQMNPPYYLIDSESLYYGVALVRDAQSSENVENVAITEPAASLLFVLGLLLILVFRYGNTKRDLSEPCSYPA